MKKFTLVLSILCISCMLSYAADELQQAMPLLQAQTRTPAQTQQVLQLFASSKQPRTIFAAGASLVRIPPAKVQENALLNLLLNNNNPLRQFFSAVILTSMGADYRELSEILREALSGADPVLHAYAAGAYTILNPQEKQYSDSIIHLYIYDPAFAQRAMNVISSGDKQTLRYLKEAARNLQDKKAAAQLLKMASKETNAEASAAIAQGLAKNQSWTLQKAVKKLNLSYKTQPAATYALALGFMTGNAIEPLKQSLVNKDINTRINAARAAAYMAGVLDSDQARLYSNEPVFDTFLLKSLIPALSALAQSGSAEEKLYAQNALNQLAKLK